MEEKEKNCSEEITEEDDSVEITEKLSEEPEETVENAENAESVENENESADEEDAVSEYNDTAAQFAEMEEELSRAKNDYIRLFAEYDNYRKRTAKEKTETYSNASAKCIENLLPVIDSFERCMQIECADENFRNGINMIFNQLKEFLNKMNVTEIDAVGKEFDPNFHNAIQKISDTDYASGYVCQVFQKGYVIGEKLVRPAMVAVAE